MALESNIMLMTQDRTIADTVKTALKGDKSLLLTDVCRESTKLRVNFSVATPQVVIMDIDPDQSQILQDLGAITSMYPEIRAVVLSERYDNELILQAMQAGARNFLQKKTIASELVKILRQLLPNELEEKRELGSVISVFSTAGGCGATTIAVNLSNELRLVSADRVLTIDLDNFYGTVSSYLGIKGKYGIADVLSHDGKIDRHLIETSASVHMKDFHILASPAGLESPKTKSIKHDNLIKVLESCRQVYKYTIIDAPRVKESVINDLAAVSDVILIVFQLMVKDVKFARNLITALTKSQVSSEKIMLLANRFGKCSSVVSLEDWQKALGVERLHKIRSDWRKAINCINCGQPIAQVAPRSRFRKDFKRLADKIYGNGTNGESKSYGGIK